MRRALASATLILAAHCGPAPSAATDGFATRFGYRRPPAGTEPRGSFAALDRRLVQAVATSQRPRAEVPAAPPIALTTSDGAGLALTALAIETAVVGPLALTQLHLTFHNPEPRVREGRFTITLPADAAVSRFAMKNEAWLEAEAVPRAEARRVYESFLKQRVDPALLEQDAGNGFSARVFPIPASSDKELIITYGHALTDPASRRVALAGLPAVGALTWTITVDGRTTRGRADHAAPADLALPPGDDDRQAVAAGDGFVARVLLPVATAIDPLAATTVLIDTSASRASLLGRQAEVARAIVAMIARTTPAAPVRVIGFDQTAEPLVAGAAGDIADAIGPALYARGGLGASDLGTGLAAAAGAERVIMIGDGIATAGDRAAAALVAQVRAAGIGRLDAVTIGALEDRDLLTALVGAGARSGAVLDGEAPDALAALTAQRGADLTVTVAGATAVWPATVHGGGPGTAVIIAGRRARGSDGPLAIQLGDHASIAVTPVAAPAPLVERAVARAQIAALAQRGAAPGRTDVERATDRATIERLGLAHRLVTRATSLLVLETDDDYARFCLRRDALADILTVADGAIQVIDRSPGVLAPPPPCNAPAAAADPGDADGVSLSGATSIDNAYVVEGINAAGNEVIVLDGRAPIIDATSTTQGMTITSEYTRNIPVGRTFGAVLGTAASAAGGAQVDALGNLHQPRGAHPLPTVFPDDESTPAVADAPPRPEPPPYEGRLLKVMTEVAARRPGPAVAEALAWYLAEPTELAAIVALGEALEARGAIGLAARAYGSLLDRFAGRAELARFTGERLDRLGPAGRALAIDAYRQAAVDRPDQAGGARLLALALARAGRHAEALDALVAALPHAAAPSIATILRADLADVAAAAIAIAPDQRAAITARVAAAGARVATAPSLRIVLHWETDANDVDLHVRDRRGGHAYFSDRALASGGALLDDITTGFGPEQFAIAGRATAGPYRIGVHYYSRGPMGLGLGTVQIIRHDGGGHLTIDDRPFVLSADGVTLDLGEIAP